jgi:hypothetical protein
LRESLSVVAEGVAVVVAALEALEDSWEEEVLGSALVAEGADRSKVLQMLAANAAWVRAFFASGAVGEVPVARREPEGVKRLLYERLVTVGINVHEVSCCGVKICGTNQDTYSALETCGDRLWESNWLRGFVFSIAAAVGVACVSSLSGSGSRVSGSGSRVKRLAGAK